MEYWEQSDSEQSWGKKLHKTFNCQDALRSTISNDE